MKKFTAVIMKHPALDAAYIEIPFDVEEVFGNINVKVKATFDGKLYRGSIVRMDGCYMIGITRALRQEIGKGPGDQLSVIIEKDDEQRIVNVPEDLEISLKKVPGLLEKFQKQSYTHQKEYVEWINEAKKEETREQRISQTVEMIMEKKK